MTETSPDKPKVIRDTDDEARSQARILLRACRSAALAVVEPDTEGFPMVSRVLVGTDVDAVPVILVSALSAHTRALLADPRASLLAGEPGKGDPLAHARLTVQCQAEQVDRASDAHARIRARFIRRHPKAQLYVDFPDFSFFRLVPLRAAMNGGFGRAYLLDGSDFILTSPAIAGLATMEESAVEHMNSDHADSVDRYAARFGEKGWRLVGIDAAGLDLAHGDSLRRIEFPTILSDSGDLRGCLKNLLN